MSKKDLGYNQPLFVLAFDHRASFAKNMLGLTGEPDFEQAKQIIDFKNVIFEGFKRGVELGVPKEAAAVLCDEQFGDAVLRGAKATAAVFAVCTEKSGQKEFDFEYGEEFGAHLKEYGPTFAKALVRYNPKDDKAMNARQLEKLKILSDYCHGHGLKFLIEPLVTALPEQLEKVGGDQRRYDLEVRPKLMVEMVKQMQEAGVEPDVWKIEGLEKTSEYEAVVKQAQAGGRDQVSAVILGRGASDEQVEKWLVAASRAPGVVGFAIGRSIFHEALMKYKTAELTREEAVEKIAGKYLHFYQVYTQNH